MSKPIKTRYCFYCGTELGASPFYDPFDTCGARECERAARDAQAEERASAHDDLDREMGWQ